MNNGYKRWIEDNLNIVNKEGVLVPFTLNAIQEKFLTQDMTGRDIVLKARQQGFSSVIIAVFTADFLLKENTYNVVVADDEDNAGGLLKRVKDYLAYWGEHNGINVDKMLKYNSKYELYFEQNNSTYKIGTAQNVNFGRSKTITNLHLSETAFYPHLTEILSGAMQAVVPNGRVIQETTANGFNEFKEYWDKTVLGETTFKAHFYPANEFYTQELLDMKRKELGRKYPQEYPDTSLEAFITSGDMYFDKDALAHYLSKVAQPIKEEIIYA